jgi:acyl-CoA dehydrogenase
MSDKILSPFLSEAHRLFRQTCRRFAQAEISPHAHEWDDAESFPRALYEKAAGAGILGIGFPEEYGGPGGDVFHAIVQIEELLAGGNSGVVASLNSLTIALPPIINLGSEEQKRRLLPPVLAGQKIAALAITEPNAGSDVAAVCTRAKREGDRYVLNGAKTFITSGVRADIVCVLARTSESRHGGLTFFIVEKGTPGFHVSPPLKKMGWRSSDTATLGFVDCAIPASQRLGAEGTGFAAAMQNFQMERLTLATYGHASAGIALREAEQYAQRRVAFGKRLIEHQIIRHKLAQMATQVHAAMCFNYVVADAIRRNQGTIEEVSQAKNFAAEVAQAVCFEAVQIFGGMGCMRETVVERLYRDVRILPIGGGTMEIMNEVIAKTRGY